MLADGLGFKRSGADPCLSTKHDQDGIMVIALCVDDMLLAAKATAQIDWIKKKVFDQFDMKDLGRANVCPGLEISRDRKQKHGHG